ncbi:MAG: DUF2069 domain-containing protein [Nevskia sp.]|nr:DUF2069 domain-containing protein [Nevskia sp.]
MSAGAIARIAALGLHLLLAAALWAWCGPLVGLALILPLLAPLPGLLRGRPYTAAWASMLVVFYVAVLMAEGVAVPARRGIGTALASVGALDFVSLVLFARLEGRRRKAAAGQTESSGGAAR